ncbi:hypothetical protein EDB82DRAFT_556772 [Fusarium venenatum]|uniref:uncharacterized protein n=1 Tax=Fusarium venenatum TaxID=56646 RepID=UPI001D295ECE|nr:hypothetical protein EDB82DRAFT_556772 [Fusarium venenatum]
MQSVKLVVVIRLITAPFVTAISQETSKVTPLVAWYGSSSAAQPVGVVVVAVGRSVVVSTAVISVVVMSAVVVSITVVVYTGVVSAVVAVSNIVMSQVLMPEVVLKIVVSVLVVLASVVIRALELVAISELLVTSVVDVSTLVVTSVVSSVEVVSSPLDVLVELVEVSPVEVVLSNSVVTDDSVDEDTSVLEVSDRTDDYVERVPGRFAVVTAELSDVDGVTVVAVSSELIDLVTTMELYVVMFLMVVLRELSSWDMVVSEADVLDSSSTIWPF